MPVTTGRPAVPNGGPLLSQEEGDARYQPRQVFDVTDPEFGAAGDGTTNDTAAVQAALDAATAAGGGTVFFPVGTYRITAGLTVEGVVEDDTWQGGGIHMVGESARESVIESVGGITLLTFTPDLSAFCSVSNLSLLGPGSGTASSVAMACDTVPHLRVDTVHIRGFETGVTAYDCTGWVWQNVRVWYVVTGLKLGYNCDGMTFVDTEFREATTGVLIGWETGAYASDSQYVNALTFQGCIFAYSTLGVSLTDKQARGVTFASCYWEGNTKDAGIGKSGRSDTSGAVGVLFTGCFFSPTENPPLAVGIEVYGRPAMRMTGCSTDGANRYTIFVKWTDLNGGSCVIEDSYIAAVTADLQVGNRNWSTGTTNLGAVSWGRRQSDYIDTVNVAASVPLKETRAYNGSGRVIEAWGRSTLSDVVTNTFEIVDSGGVLRVGGGATESAFITATSVAALPSAGANYRGCLAFVPGGAGVTDTLYVCLKASADTYSWRSITTGG